MSLILSIYLSDGIVVAADKRITNKDTGAVYTDTEQKLFLSDNKFVISFCGDADINGIPVRHYIKDFLQNVSFETTKDAANAVKDHMLAISASCKLSFLISGYSSTLRSVREINTYNEMDCEHVDGDLFAGMVYNGERDVLNSLLANGAPNWHAMTLTDAVSFAKFAIGTTSAMLSFQGGCVP